jgi:hypothetical protein
LSKVQRFTDEVLIGLLRALRARSASHPETPWLVAYWPGVQEEQMAAACGELIRRGHPITSIPLAGRRRGAARSAWAVATGGRSARADAGADLMRLGTPSPREPQGEQGRPPRRH